MEQLAIDLEQGPALAAVVELQQERAKTLVEMAANSRFFYQEVTEFDAKAARKNLTASSCEVLEDMLKRLSSLAVWQAEPIHDEVKACSVAREVGMGKVAQPIRVAITGNTISPPLDLTLELLGRERTLSAIRYAIEWIQAQLDDQKQL